MLDNPQTSSLSHSITRILLKAFRYLVPRPEDRIEITWMTTWDFIPCFVLLIYMAYLARRPDTYCLRLALLPCVVYHLLLATYAYGWTDPQFSAYNWVRSILFLVALLKVVDIGLAPVGMLKKGEVKPGIYHSDYKPPPASMSDRPILCAPTWFSDALHLLQSVRGQSYQFSEGIYIPPPTRPQSPTSAFFRATLISFFANFLLLDLAEASLKKFFPLVGHPSGGSIFDPSLPIYPIPWRYFASTVALILSGFIIQRGFCLIYDVFTLIGVGLCGQEAKDWPPIMVDPWTSDSLHAYWGQRWHQNLRRSVLLLGGYPAERVTTTVMSLLGAKDNTKKLAGNMAILFGAFVVTGLFHECTIYSMGRGLDHKGWIFFALQAPLMIVERFWRKITGRSVRGLWGWSWAVIVLLLGGQPLYNSWHVRGLGGNMVIPPVISPARRVIFPVASATLSWLGIEGILSQ